MSEPVKRRPGRPQVVIDQKKLTDALAKGLMDIDVASYLGISMSSWMRYKRDHEAHIAGVRAASAYDTWKAIQHACSAKNGRKVNIGAATMLLRRLERGG